MVPLTFAYHETDASGLDVDFGQPGYLRRWIEKHLDHACLFNQDDPERERLMEQFGGLFKAYTLPNCSCEGLAKHLFEIFEPMVSEASESRAWIIAVEVEEDAKNSARYCID